MKKVRKNMITNDSCSDMLSRIRNALMVSKESVDVPFSGLNEAILKILATHGFIRRYDVKTMDNGVKYLSVVLKYYNKESVIRGIKRVSSPSKRIYRSSEAIPQCMDGFGITLVSTSTGVLTQKDCKEQKVGGEVLAQVW